MLKAKGFIIDNKCGNQVRDKSASITILFSFSPRKIYPFPSQSSEAQLTGSISEKRQSLSPVSRETARRLRSRKTNALPSFVKVMSTQHNSSFSILKFHFLLFFRRFQCHAVFTLQTTSRFLKELVFEKLNLRFIYSILQVCFG